MTAIQAAKEIAGDQAFDLMAMEWDCVYAGPCGSVCAHLQ
jgi:hypothetical protein